jgi:hypothetical protein
MKNLILIAVVAVAVACSESASERLERKNKLESERVKKINDSLEWEIKLETVRQLSKQSKK